MKVIWGIVSIITTAICFFIGSYFFAFEANEYFAKSLGSTEPISTSAFFILLLLGIIFYILGILSVRLLIQKSNIIYGYITSVIFNVILILILVFTMEGGVLDVFWGNFILRHLCEEGAQLNHIDKNTYDIEHCYVNVNYHLKFYKKGSE